MKTYISKGDNLVLLLYDDMSICSPVYRFLRFQQAKGSAFNTRKAFARDLKTYFQFLQIKGISYFQAQPKDIVDFLIYLRHGDFFSNDAMDNIVALEQRRTASTINRIVGTVHRFYAFLVEIEGVSNPVRQKNGMKFDSYSGLLEHTKSGRTNVNAFKVKSNKPEFHLISETDANSIEKALLKYGEKYKLIFRIMRFTGARIQEVLDLTIDKIPAPDPDSHIVIFKDIKSKGKRRNLYVPQQIVEEINLYLIEERGALHCETPYLFVGESKNKLGTQLSYSAFYQKLKIAAAEVGVDCNCHDLRHTLCTALLRGKMSPVYVKEIMGHSRISTTMIYEHLNNDDVTAELQSYWIRKGIAYESTAVATNFSGHGS